MINYQFRFRSRAPSNYVNFKIINWTVQYIYYTCEKYSSKIIALSYYIILQENRISLLVKGI